MFSLFTALSIQKRPAVVLDTYYILAAAVLLICLIILVCCICKHRRKKKNNARRGSEQLIYKPPKPATEYRKVQPLKSELAAMVRNQLLYFALSGHFCCCCCCAGPCLYSTNSYALADITRTPQKHSISLGSFLISAEVLEGHYLKYTIIPYYPRL